MPFSRSHSTALSISPSEAVSAFLQSIMPTPVISRRFFTSAAVKAILNSSKQFWYIARRCAAGARLLSVGSAASSAAASAVCSPCLPSSTALAMMEEISLMARMASSLPGIT